MPKLAKLLLRIASLGVFAAVIVYQLQSGLAGQELPGFRFVSLLFLVGVLGVWQLTAAPQETEDDGPSLPEIRFRTNMVFWFASAALALVYALHAVLQGSRDDAALGLGVVLFGLFAGTISAFWLRGSRQRAQASRSPRPHA